MYKLRIKEFRQQRGVSQQKLAEILNITPQYLSSIENGKRFFHEWHERRIVKALDLSPDEAAQMIGQRPYRDRRTARIGQK